MEHVPPSWMVVAGWPCVNVSELLTWMQRVKWATCIRDAVGDTGEGFDQIRKFNASLETPVYVGENAPRNAYVYAGRL